MKKGNVIALGALAGLAVGALAGILFAPEKGSEIRKQIKRKSDGFMDDIKSKLDDFRNSIAGKLDRTKRDADHLAGEGKAKYEEAKKEVKNATSDFKHSVS